MAGFRTFATGEVLTAANVNNFLMGQSVMRFADATARTAALGTDVVEGMLTYNLATDQLEVFDGTNFVVAAPAAPAGIGSNVVQTVKTDTTSTTSTTFVTTGLEATITPTSASSKILILVSVAHSCTSQRMVHFRLSGGNAATYIGNADSTIPRTAVSATVASNTDLTSSNIVFLDAPATDTAITYTLQFRQADTGPAFINRPLDGTVSENRARTASSITVIEVAA